MLVADRRRGLAGSEEDIAAGAAAVTTVRSGVVEGVLVGVGVWFFTSLLERVFFKRR